MSLSLELRSDERIKRATLTAHELHLDKMKYIAIKDEPIRSR